MEHQKIQKILARILIGEKIIIPSQYVPDDHIENRDYWFYKHNFDTHQDMILKAMMGDYFICWGYKFGETHTDISMVALIDIIITSINNGWRMPNDDEEHNKTVDIISQLI